MSRSVPTFGDIVDEMRAEGFTLIELLIVVAIIGIIAAISVPNLMNAADHSKQKRTMADLRAIGTAIDRYATERSAYPEASDLVALKEAIDPMYIRGMPERDGWSHELVVHGATTGYTIYSTGKDGAGSDCTPGRTVRFEDEICYSHGQFIRYPEGAQR